MPVTDEEFRLFRDLIYRESGIYLKEARKDFLENRLLKRMDATAVSSPYWYYKLITDNKRTELLIFLDLLTVNETFFFRNRPQIELFRNIILPDVMERRARYGRKQLRIWSAGCSTGEEPYTIAMVIRDAYPSLFGSDVRILASDLSLTALDVANAGEYEKGKVRANVEAGYISRYFVEKEESYQVSEEIRRMVVFDFHNLKNDNGMTDLDVIWCRNVMIYFDEDEQKRLIEKFYRGLNPEGYLMLGHAETLHGLNTGLEFLYENKGTAYRKPREEKA